jgi:hypothetical protein
LINSVRYGYIRQGVESVGLKTQHFVHFRGLDDPFGFDTSTATIVPVHNFADDLTWTKGNHTLQFGGSYQRIKVNPYNYAGRFVLYILNECVVAR